MDLPNVAGDVLSQPARARLFAALGELGGPASTGQLATRLGLHPNGVRNHLERLRDAGLVTRERVRQPRGRPRDMWRVADGAEPGGEPPSAYSDLGRWLARATPPSKASLRRVEAAGREIGRELAPRDSDATGEPALHAALASLGFQPRREPSMPDGTLTYTLCNCPYRDAASERMDVVCTLHRGLTRGLLDEISPTTELTAFVPRDPRIAGCLIQLRGGLTADAGEGDDAGEAIGKT